VALALAAVLTTAACGSGGGAKPTSTSVKPPTTRPVATTRTTLAGPTNPEPIARALYAAWKTGDRAAAAKVATAPAVAEQFARPYQPIQTSTGPMDPYIFRECVTQKPGESAVCTFTGQDSELDMQVGTTGPGQPLVVVAVKFVATGAH